jgi:hypothetical protein
MKKLTFLLGLGAICAAFLFNACTDEVNPAPTITFDEASPIVLAAGVTSVTLTGTIVAEAKLKEVVVTKTMGLSETQLGTYNDFSSGTFTSTDDINVNFRYDVDGITENTTIKFTATDKDDQISSQSIEIQVTALGLITHSGIELGAQNNATGSFFASFEGNIYTTGELKDGNHYDDIDIVYYFGASNKQALFSPWSIVDNDISWSGLVPVANWGDSPNQTMFKKATEADYNDATYTSVQELAVGANLDYANGGEEPPDGLDVNDVYIFVTADGKYGIFKVTAVGASNSDTITIDVKIQEEE